FFRLQKEFPESRWAEFAGQRLSELFDASGLFQKAIALFDQDRFNEALKLFLQVRKQAGEKALGQQAAYFAAVCLFKTKIWHKSSFYFHTLLDDFPGGSYSAEALYHLGLISKHLGDNYQALNYYRKVMDEFSETRWADHSRKAVEELELTDKP
ncbi:MAG: tetratricopeptide repeat protein, partial [Deltaproteobacteria bacterium]|nr:tetratricopeptide repeat protein [Deltaproteobacteria bacterium]